MLTHNGVRVLSLQPLGGGAALSPGTDGVVPWTGGFIVGTRNEVRVIKSKTLKGEPHSALRMSVLSLDRKV